MLIIPCPERFNGATFINEMGSVGIELDSLDFSISEGNLRIPSLDAHHKTMVKQILRNHDSSDIVSGA